MLELEDFSAHRRRFETAPLSVQLLAGRIALLGLNGAGKSTLIEGLIGKVRHSGSLRFEGRAVPGLPPRVFGYVPQHQLFPVTLSARECVRGAADLKKVGRSARDPAVLNALEAVGLEAQAGTRASRLSGGQARRLACAQAIVHRPPVLVMDEPTAGLDPVQRAAIREFLDRRKPSTLTLVTTQILEDVAEWADRFLVLDAGRLVVDVTRAQLPPDDRQGSLMAMLQEAAC